MVHLDHKLRPSRTRATRPTLTFANGKTVEADLVIGADGIKSVVRKQLFSDKEPMFSGEHAYRAVISVDDAYGMVTDDNLRMYIGKGTKVYLLPLRHRNAVSFDITALDPDGAWAPKVSKEYMLKTVEGFDERIVNITRDLDMDTVNVRARLRHRPGRRLALGLRRAARRRRALDAAPPGPGRELGDPGRRRCRRRPRGGRLCHRGAGAVPGQPQAGDRRTAAHLAPGGPRTSSTTSSPARSRPRPQEV